jgi:hypothetical protein
MRVPGGQLSSSGPPPTPRNRVGPALDNSEPGFEGDYRWQRHAPGTPSTMDAMTAGGAGDAPGEMRCGRIAVLRQPEVLRSSDAPLRRRQTVPIRPLPCCPTRGGFFQPVERSPPVISLWLHRAALLPEPPRWYPLAIWVRGLCARAAEPRAVRNFLRVRYWRFLEKRKRPGVLRALACGRRRANSWAQR